MVTKSQGANDKVTETVRKYSDMVYKLALSRTKNKADADDVFQEVFLRYMKNIDKIEDEEHLKAWLIRVTVNCSKSLSMTAWARNTVPLDEEISFSTPEQSDVYFATLELPPKYRTVIHLFYYEDMSVAQIAEALETKESTVKSQLSRAREMLKQKLKGGYDYV